MAALVCIVYSLSVQVYRIGCVFVESGGSLSDCVNYITETRKTVLINRYLANIDVYYDLETVCNQFIDGNRCFNCKKKLRKMSNEIILGTEDFLKIEQCQEAFEIISKQAVNDSQTKLLNEAGIVYCDETKVDLTPGGSFYITGNILKNCEGFAVNLSYGHFHKDIALHVNPRLPQNYIVRNSKINGNWGKEEVTSALPFTLKRGNPFGIQILVTESEYLISVNGLHYALYTHRVPYQRVTCIQVTGGVSDVHVEHLPVQEYPDKTIESQSALIPVVQTVDKIHLNAENNLVMPFYGKLAKTNEYGSRIHIFGRVKVLPHSFYINLQHGEQIWPHPTIAFHLNPRFAMIGGKHVIVKNSWLDGKWEREERGEIHTDFMPSRSFHMTIECGDQCYNVYLNDKFIADFKFRVKPDIVDTIYIHGDINLKHISQEIHGEPHSLLTE